MNKYDIKKMNAEDFRLIYGISFEQHPDYENFKNDIFDYYALYLNEEYQTIFSVDKLNDNRLTIFWKLFEDEAFRKELCNILKEYPYISYFIYFDEQKQSFSYLDNCIEVIKEEDKIENLNNVHQIFFKIKS